MELKMMFYLSNVAIAVNISQPSVRIGGGLHALIHIFFYTGFKVPKRFGAFRPPSNRGDGVRVILHYFYSAMPSIPLRREISQLKEAIEADTFVQERAPGTSIKLQNSHFTILP